jgi:hypothetical protein
VKVSPVGETKITYPVIEDPSWFAPLNVMTALRSPATAVTVVGASGIPEGVTEFDDADGEFPIEFRATAVNVYAVPFVKPVMTQDVAGDVAVHVCRPFIEVKIIAVTESPPEPAIVSHGPDAETVAVSSPATAVTDVGASATPAILIGADAVDESERPTALVAVTLNV